VEGTENEVTRREENSDYFEKYLLGVERHAVVLLLVGVWREGQVFHPHTLG
jgi:hypothetical protein